MSSNVTVIYTGRHGAVQVPCPDGRVPDVQWGDELVTTADHAASLLEQKDNWKRAPRARKTTAEKATTKEK